jgi:hypothetical protein
MGKIFYDVVEPVLNIKVEIPDNIQQIIQKTKQAKQINASFEELVDF